MKYWHRICLAIFGLILSLPAFVALFIGLLLMNVVSGFNGTWIEVLSKLVFAAGNARTIIIASIPFLLMCHVISFCYLLIQFARGKYPPILLQMYCLVVVIGVAIERIRLIYVANENGAFFWFGLFSLPHALVLMALIVMNKHFPSSRLKLAVDNKRRVIISD